MYAGNWICIYAGLGCIVLSLLTTLSLPETRPSPSAPESCGQPPPYQGPIRSFRECHRLIDFFKSTVVLARRSFYENKKLGLLLLFCVFTTAGSHIPLMLAWQSSERPDALDLAIFLSIIWSNILRVVLLTIILPLVSYLLAQKLGLNPLKKDVYISAVSIVGLVAGSLGLVVAKATGSTLVIATIYIYALGCGYGPAMHSLLGLLSGGCHIGMLYAIIGAMQSVGVFLGGVLFGGSFETAPFLFTVLFLVLVAGALFLIQLEDGQQRQPIWIHLDDLVVHNVSP
ncbi:hypothetical protein J3458_020629 [Metarhizium acridum]|uniref:uncharacterized protein n=1 Tax=Metarhizium acridum TaxID=92637 RepID=UPI001C6CB661|nr:hypothetical protein J3458_020629 [Metarhizium acridum]